MSTPMDAIEDRIAALIDAAPAFTSLAHINKGLAYMVPDAWFPLAEVLLWEAQLERSQTGGRDIIHYIGEIRFWIRMVDKIESEGRISTLTTGRVLRKYVRDMRSLLRANPKLGDLSGEKWAVRRVDVPNEEEYAAGQRSAQSDKLTARENNWQLTGRIPFLVELQEDTP